MAGSELIQIRHYDTVLGRWMCVDSLQEKSLYVSTYFYVNSNLVKFIDLGGDEPTPAEAARIAVHVYGNRHYLSQIGH